MSSIPKKRPVKLIGDLIRLVKNFSSERDFPYPNISKCFTIGVWRLYKEWQSVKNVPEQRDEFIKELKKDSAECEENNYLHNSRGDGDEE